MRASEFITEARGQKTDQDTIDLVKMLWDEGKKTKAISDNLGLPRNKVAHILATYHQSRSGQQLAMSTALTDQDKTDIVAKFLNNGTVRDIAKEYGIDKTTIMNTLKNKLGADLYNAEMGKRRDIPGERIRNKVTPDMIIKMKELYVAGKTLSDISNYFNNVINVKTVSMTMRRQPDYEEIRAKREENTRKVKHGPVVTTKITRSGEIGNNRSKGPSSRHTSGVNWPKYG